MWIENGYISFDSLPAEVEKIHIPDIRLSIDYANRKYRELCWQRRLKRLEEQAGQHSEREEMLALQQRVRDLLGETSAQAVAAPVPEVLPLPAVAAAPASADVSVVAAPAPIVAEPQPQPAAAAAAPATPLSEFEQRRAALKQIFRTAAANQDKEQK